MGKIDGKNITFVDSAMSSERNIFVENKYRAGDYLILVEVYWSNKVVNKLNIGTYSDRDVELELLQGNQQLYDKSEY
ncbi:MAG: hypothetical protein GY786_03575 [Proteobacteria bacterium]|nr:hypothetical protein [Pseudomonadota bacterium]